MKKNQYEIICGSSKNEWGIELLKLGDYLCWFNLAAYKNIPNNNIIYGLYKSDKENQKVREFVNEVAVRKVELTNGI